MSEKSAQGAGPVLFSEKLASSQAFAGLFQGRHGAGRGNRQLSGRGGPAGIQEARPLRRARLCNRKHAADHAADAACLLAVAAPRREGRRDVARPGQQGKDQGQALARRPRRCRHHGAPARAAARPDRPLARPARPGAPARRHDAQVRPATARRATPWSASSACSRPPSSARRGRRN